VRTDQRTSDPSLEGKVALVTASTDGLGFACALRLAEAGCAVVVCGRRQDRVEGARAAIAERSRVAVVGVSTDLGRADDIDRLFRRTLQTLGRLDILVVNSGHVPYGGLESHSDETWQMAFELLLMSAVRLARLAVPVMRSQGGGDIVFLTSSVVKEPKPHLLLSSVMRTGVVALAKTLSRTLAGDNIRVNTVAPGYFNTGRIRARLDELRATYGLGPEEALRRVAGEIPQGRLGDSRELAELVTFLASRQTAFLTGATIVVDGGAGSSLL
jgi:3-oxoacyl-[acyl-carrier protein] reductase